jgi:hypothetical protein
MSCHQDVTPAEDVLDEEADGELATEASDPSCAVHCMNAS